MAEFLFLVIMYVSSAWLSFAPQQWNVSCIGIHSSGKLLVTCWHLFMWLWIIKLCYCSALGELFMTPVIRVIVIVEMTCQLALAAELVLLTDSDSREDSWTRTSDEFSADNKERWAPDNSPVNAACTSQILSQIVVIHFDKDSKKRETERGRERDYQNKLICSHFPHFCEAALQPDS